MRGGGLQRWQQYDDELEDSDQTISALPRVRTRGLASLPPPPLAALSQTSPFLSQSQPQQRKPPPVKSAFFFETTDEEELSGVGSEASESAVKRTSDADAARSRRAGRRKASHQHLPLAAPQGALAMSASQPVSSSLQRARLHIGEIQFPVTRSVLW